MIRNIQICILTLLWPLATVTSYAQESAPPVVASNQKGVIMLAENLPQRDPIALHAVTTLTRSHPQTEEENQVVGNGFPGKENSGIVKSRNQEDLYWVHNDSGDDPKVYPIHSDGKDYQLARYAGELGVTIAGAINVDWEDITADGSGNIIIADVGNNRNDRRDLVLYVVPEPAPSAGRTTYMKRYFVRYPDQASFPAPKDQFNFDCEGVFTIGDTIHCFSKNRSDRHTTLYRLDDPKNDELNTLTKLDTIDLNGQVVGADASDDGKRLAVITYTAIWLFERDATDQSFFQGSVYWAPYKADQIEAVCFSDSGKLKLIDEATGILYEVFEKDLSQIR